MDRLSEPLEEGRETIVFSGGAEAPDPRERNPSSLRSLVEPRELFSQLFRMLTCRTEEEERLLQ